VKQTGPGSLDGLDFSGVVLDYSGISTSTGRSKFLADYGFGVGAAPSVFSGAMNLRAMLIPMTKLLLTASCVRL